MTKTKPNEPAAPPMSLFEIGSEFLALEEAMMASGDEWTEELEQRFGSIEALERSQERKVDGYIALIKRSEVTEEPLTAQAKWHEAQAKSLKTKVKTAENFRERLKTRLLQHMQRLNLKEMSGSIWNIARHLNGGTRKILVSAQPDELPESFRKWVPPTVGHWVADEDAIRAELLRREKYVKACFNEGVTIIAIGKLDGMAELEPQGEHIKIV